jgi:hypothetical protein
MARVGTIEVLVIDVVTIVDVVDWFASIEVHSLLAGLGL